MSLVPHELCPRFTVLLNYHVHEQSCRRKSFRIAGENQTFLVCLSLCYRNSATFFTDATFWLHVHLHSLLGHSMSALLSGTWGPLVYHNYCPTSLLSPRKKGTNIPGAHRILRVFAVLQAPVQRVGLLPVTTSKSRSLSVFWSVYWKCSCLLALFKH